MRVVLSVVAVVAFTGIVAVAFTLGSAGDGGGGGNGTAAQPSVPAATGAGEPSLWYSDGSRGDLVRVDPATGEIATTWEAVTATDVVVGDSHVWMLVEDSGELTGVDRETARYTDTFVVPGATALGVGDGSVFVTAGDEVVPLTEAGPGSPVEIGRAVAGVSGDWVLAGDSLFRLDEESGVVEVTGLDPLFAPVALVADRSGRAWLIGTSGMLLSVDADGRIDSTMIDGIAPLDLAVDGDSVWVLADSEVLHVGSEGVLGRVVVPAGSVGLAVTAEGAWVAAGNQLTRIDRFDYSVESFTVDESTNIVVLASG